MTRDGQKHNKMWLLAVALLLPLLAAAQEPADSIDVAPLPQSQEQRALADSLIASPMPNVALNVDSLAAAAVAAIRPRTFHPDPIRSQWVSMVLPGGGQIYNRKFWKLPIIYGGFLGCAYALSWNGQMLRDYSQAYLDIMDSDPDTKSYEKMLPLGYDITGREDKFKEIFKNKKNYYRKYRDLSILAFVAVYVIGIIDAYVDAELSSFDISPDLSLRMTPTILNSTTSNSATPTLRGNASGLGLAMTLDF